ncbi:MAG: porin [Acetobacteraceae bacterium]
MRRFLLMTAMGVGVSLCAPRLGQAAGLMPTPGAPPGSIEIYLNGRLNWFAAAIGENDNTTSAAGTTKVSNYAFLGYIRLYPGFSAKLANGIEYGAKGELRDGTSPTNTGAYWRRAVGYIGTAQLGTVYFGQYDGPMSLFLTGNFENFNSGGWNGDEIGFVSSPYTVDWPLADTSHEYTIDRFTYLSPTFFGGFDFGASFAPSSTLYATMNGAVPVETRDASIPGGSATPRNLYEVVGRYQGTFSGVGIVATAGYEGSSIVANNTGPTGYHDLSVGDFGATLSYAGLMVGGHLDVGQFNTNFTAPAPKGSKSAMSYVLGASYEVGPVIGGVQFIHNDLPGAYNGSSVKTSLHETGVTVGGTYTLASGFLLYATYMYGERNQPGYDFINGSDKVHTNIFALGTSLRW